MDESDSCEWTTLSVGDFNVCISTAAGLHSVDLNPLQSVLYSSLPLIEFQRAYKSTASRSTMGHTNMKRRESVELI